jgi:hypothetical protein
MPQRPPIQIHIRVALYMWFCDHSEWWGVWIMGGVSHLCFDLCGWSTGCSPFGAWFDLVGGQVDIHIRVCMSNPVN